MVEADGNKVSSRIVSIALSDSPHLLLVGPNPFDDLLQVKIKSVSDKTIAIHIIDITGKIVHKQSFRINKGNNTLQLKSLSRLMKGMYVLRIGDDAYLNTIKVMKK